MGLILIIDDSSYQRTALRDMLYQAGHHVVEAVDGQEGLEKIAEFIPDCIVSDLLMPRLGGLELLETLQTQDSIPPIIIVTSSRQQGVRERCLELGAAAFLNKPLREDQLLSAVRNALGQSQSSGDNR